MEIKSKVCPDNSIDISNLLNNIGVTYENMGEYQTARKYLAQSLEICKKVYGENHPEYAKSLNNIGDA